MSLIIEAVTPKMPASEGPFWDVQSQCLYFVDVFGQAICKYTPSTNTYSRGVMPNSSNNSLRVTFVIPIRDETNNFVVGYGGEIVKIRWDGVSENLEKLETIIDIKSVEESTAYWNDAKVDSNGKLWVGYYRPTADGLYKSKSGGLYSVDLSKKTLKKQFSNTTLANGMGWDKSNKKFYFADSYEDELMQFDCDIDSRQITNKQVIFKCNAERSFPDGMTVDANDNLWVATFAKTVVNIDTKNLNTILRTIEMPVRQITSCTFGGSNLDELYVTSASIERGGEKPDGGYVYRIRGLGIKGAACQKARC